MFIDEMLLNCYDPFGCIHWQEKQALSRKKERGVHHSLSAGVCFKSMGEGVAIKVGRIFPNSIRIIWCSCGGVTCT